MTSRPASASTTATDQRGEKRPRTRWGPLLALASGTTMLVTGEFLPASVLPIMAADLGVSVGVAGLAVAVTAVAGAVTAPSLPVLLPRVDRRRLLVALLVLGAVANAAVAWSPSFALLLVGRMVLGAAIAGFWSFAFGVGVTVAPHRPGVVSAAIVGGVSAATVIAVPVASVVGDHLDWRVAFWGAAALTLLVAAAVRVTLPSVPAHPTAGWAMLRQTVAQRRLMLGIGCIVLTAFGNFAAYPYIRVVIGRVDPTITTTLLMVWGIGGLVGNVAAGALARRLRLVAALAPLLLGSSLLAAASTRSVPMLVVAVAAWGLTFNAVPVATQLWVTRVEPHRAESAVSLQVTAFQVAITAGSALGGVLLDYRGLTVVLLVGGSAAIAGGLGFAAIRLPRSTSTAPPGGGDPVADGVVRADEDGSAALRRVRC